MLITVGDHRVLHETDVGKAHHGQQCHAEKCPGKQERPAPAVSVSPQYGRYDQGRRQGQPPQHIAGSNVPLRIDKG